MSQWVVPELDFHTVDVESYSAVPAVYNSEQTRSNHLHPITWRSIAAPASLCKLLHTRAVASSSSGISVNTCGPRTGKAKVVTLDVRGNCAEYCLFAVPAGDGSGRQVGCGVHVRADRRSEAETEIVGEPDLLLSTMRGVAGHGTPSGRCTEYGRVGYDPRTGQRRPIAEPGSMGGLARNRGAAARGRTESQRSKGRIRKAGSG